MPRRSSILPAAFRRPAAASPPGAGPARPRLPLTATLIAIAAAVVLAGCGGDSGVADDEAARVNGTVITLERLERESKAYEQQQAGSGQAVDANAASRQALQSLIQQRVVLDGAKAEGIEVSDADVDAKMKEYEEQVAAQGQTLDQLLQQQGVSRDDLRDSARVEVTVERVSEKLVPGKSDAELQAEIDKNRANYVQVQARHVLVEQEAEAKAIRTSLADKGDWAEQAKKSQDPGTKEKGGDLGFMSKGGTVPPFEEAMYALAEQGDCKGANGACESPVSQPVKSDFGWHVIQVTGVRLPSLEEIRAQLEGQELGPQRQTAVQDWYKELVTAAQVELNPRFGEWDAANGRIADRDTQPSPAPTQPTPGPTPETVPTPAP